MPRGDVVVGTMVTLALGLTLSWLSRRNVLRRAAASEAQRLTALWVGAIETMLMKERLVLQPAATDEESRLSFVGGLPSELATGRSFALTAFDPPGVTRSREDNAEANAELWKALKDLKPPDVWPAFGVDVDEGWREDGFVLRWPDSQADAARDRVLAIASDFDQGAIYEYYAVDGALRRRTLGAKLAHIHEETPMKRLHGDPTHPLFQLPWAGPDDVLTSSSSSSSSSRRL